MPSNAYSAILRVIDEPEEMQGFYKFLFSTSESYFEFYNLKNRIAFQDLFSDQLKISNITSHLYIY